jgi:diguanylate cyclase
MAIAETSVVKDTPSNPAPAAGIPGARNAYPNGHNSEADSLRPLMNGLFSMLSHDLRTPLSGISAWLFLLESETLDPAARKRALAKIRTNVEEQVQLIDDALLLSRCKTGHLQLDVAPISALVPLSAAVESARPSAIAKGIDLKMAAPGQVGIVNADAERLRRVFELLLARAVRSTPAGGTVRTAVQARDGYIDISIADNGAGFSAAAMRFVLNPFGTQDKSSGPPGQGVSRELLLASALVEAHDGQLQVASPGEGLGSTFTVELPAPGVDG